MRIAQNSGLTLIEVMIVTAIIGTLAAIAVPNFINYRLKAQQTRAILELGVIEKEAIGYNIENGFFPETLADIGMDTLMDPWGRPYQYLRLELPDDGKKGNKGNIGKARKDHFLVPVNTDFDLYSMGQDGKSMPPFTAKNSRDDIVRANNGGYHGLASEY